jgi:hypothetical protein
MKPVGKPDAGNRHIRFDERGWETGRWPQAPSYRAYPRLYQTHLSAKPFTHDDWLELVAKDCLHSRITGYSGQSRLPFAS